MTDCPPDLPEGWSWGRVPDVPWPAYRVKYRGSNVAEVNFRMGAPFATEAVDVFARHLASLNDNPERPT